MKIIRPTKITSAMYVASNLAENDYPAYDANKVYGKRERCISLATHRVYESLRGETSNVGITQASPAVISWQGHGLSANAKVRFTNSGGALPTGLTTDTDYYVSATNLTVNSFCVSSSAGGGLVATTTGGSGIHTCTQNINKGFDPTVAANIAGTSSSVTANTMWLEVSGTMKWRYFDETLNAQASAANELTLSVRPGLVDSIAFFNLDAKTVRIVVKDLGSGSAVVSDKTYSMISTKNVKNWRDYFFEPIIRADKLVVTNLPLYGNCQIDITISSPGATARCGEIVMGRSRDIGTLLWRPSVKIANYGRKKRDDFGNAKWQKGNFADLLTCQLRVDNSSVDEVKRVLTEFRDTPAVFYGEGPFTSTTIYGVYNGFELVIDSPAGSDCNLDLEGII